MEVLKIMGILVALWSFLKLIQFCFLIRPKREMDNASIHAKLDHLMSEMKEAKSNISKMESRIKDIHYYLGLEFPDENDKIYKEHPELYFEHIKAVAKRKGAVTKSPKFGSIPLQIQSPGLLSENLFNR